MNAEEKFFNHLLNCQVPRKNTHTMVHCLYALFGYSPELCGSCDAIHCGYGHVWSAWSRFSHDGLCFLRFRLVLCSWTNSRRMAFRPFWLEKVYFWSITLWSTFTLLQGFLGFFGSAGTAVMVLFGLRFLVGLAEAPSFPANSRIVATWFPSHERGTAAATFNSAQYFATVLFAPIMGYITYKFGWEYVFFFMGALGIIVAFIWLKTIYGPKEHPRINQAELEYIEAGGALINMDQTSTNKEEKKGVN